MIKVIIYLYFFGFSKWEFIFGVYFKENYYNLSDFIIKVYKTAILISNHF